MVGASMNAERCSIALIALAAVFVLSVAICGEPADDAQHLLAEKERKLGPAFPGKDPAFLILPRPLERSETARELADACKSAR